jgi:hypothetical protein
MKYRYDLAILGIKLSYEARSLPELRAKILVKYLRYIGPDQRHWPLVPTVMLLGTNDPRIPSSAVPDPRLSSPDPRAAGLVPKAINPVISLSDWKNRVERQHEASNTTTDSRS